MRLFGLEGRAAFVTGGNGGIGLGISRAFAEAGATVAIAARNRQKAEAAVAALKEGGADAFFVALDLAQEASCREAVAAAAERLGRLDILVNNGGTTVRKPAELYTGQEWRLVLETNLSGAFFCCQAAYPWMKKAGRCFPFSAPVTPFLTRRAKGLSCR